MLSPPIGKSQRIQLWLSLNCVTHSKDTKKNAEAEPEKMPINAQMKIHLKVRRMFFFGFIIELILNYNCQSELVEDYLKRNTSTSST